MNMRKLGPCFASAILASMHGCAFDTERSQGSEQVAVNTQAYIFSPDNRIALTNTYFNSHPSYRAVGLVAAPGHGCTGTRVDAGYVLTAAHCIPSPVVPQDIHFYPAFIPTPGDDDLMDLANKPRVTASQVIVGTGIDYLPGADWALIAVDPTTYVNAPPGFPTWDSYPLISMSEIVPTDPSNVIVTSVGYSADFRLNFDTGSVDPGCKVTKNSPYDVGVYLSDCDFTGGASGGPVLFGTSSENVIAINGGGHEDTLTTYSDDKANLLVNSKGPLWAPWSPAGLAASRDSGNRTHVFATDSAFGDQLTKTRQVAQGQRFARWFDFRSGSAVPSPDRMSAVTADSHQFVFAVAHPSGQVFANWETSPSGAWNGWTTFFGGESQSASASDIASLTTSQISLYQFVMRTNGTIYARRKTGGWSGPWSAWQTLSASLGSGVSALAITAAQTGGFPVLVLATSNGLQIRWATDLGGTSWVGWGNFADGLPAGIRPIDVEMGQTADGRLDVFLLARQTSGGVPSIWRRTKVSAVQGSAWGSWNQYRSSSGVPELAKATQITLQPLPALPGAMDGLLMLAGGNVLYSAWDAGGVFRGFFPFYGVDY